MNRMFLEILGFCKTSVRTEESCEYLDEYHWGRMRKISQESTEVPWKLDMPLLES